MTSKTRKNQSSLTVPVILGCLLMACGGAGSSSNSTESGGGEIARNFVGGGAGGIAPVVVNDGGFGGNGNVGGNIGSSLIECQNQVPANIEVALTQVTNGLHSGDLNEITNPLNLFTGFHHDPTGLIVPPNGLVEPQTQIGFNFILDVANGTLQNPNSQILRFYDLVQLNSYKADPTGPPPNQVMAISASNNMILPQNTDLGNNRTLIGIFNDSYTTISGQPRIGIFDHSALRDRHLVGRICDLQIDVPNGNGGFDTIFGRSNEIHLVVREGWTL